MRRIGGSDIAKLLGLSKYGGPLEVYQRIVEGVDAQWSTPMERGAMMEPVLRAHAQRMFGLELEDLPSEYVESPEHEFAHAQLDDLGRWKGVPVVPEYKSKNRFVRGFARGPDGDVVPPDIEAQVAWQLMCTGRELGLVIVGFGEDTKGPDGKPDGGFDLHNIVPFEVQRDRQYEAYCVHVARTFWLEHVLRRVPPVVQPQKRRRAS